MSDGNLKGKKFGSWTVIRDLDRHEGSVVRKVLCECSCGLRRMVIARDLTEGRSEYCGKHSRHPERRTPK